MVEVELSDIVLWLSVSRPHPDLGQTDWGNAPLQTVVTPDASLVSFECDHILASDEALASFLRAIAELRARAALSVTADVAIFFEDAAATRNFALPFDFMRRIGGAVDQINISVYLTEAIPPTDAAKS